MGADASPLARFRRAVDRRLLTQAEAAAREMPTLRSDDALALLLLMRDEHDSRFDLAATRWLGMLLAAHPQVGLGTAADLADALADLTSGSPDVARSRTAVLLRSAGAVSAAEVIERW